MSGGDVTCDRCTARAQYRYRRDGQTLALCGHHGRQHGPALREHGWFTYRVVEMARR